MTAITSPPSWISSSRTESGTIWQIRRLPLQSSSMRLPAPNSPATRQDRRLRALLGPHIDVAGRLAAAGRAEDAAVLCRQAELDVQLELTVILAQRHIEIHCTALCRNLREMDSLISSTAKDRAMETRHRVRASRSPPGVLVYS